MNDRSDRIRRWLGRAGERFSTPRAEMPPLVDIVATIAGIALFVAMLTLHVPLAIRRLTPALLGSYSVLLLMLAESLAETIQRSRQRPRFLDRAPDVLRASARALLPIVAFVVVALPVANAWQKGRGGYFAIGGLLPWSDASNYYAGAVGINERGEMGSWNQRRPLNAAINSVKLRVGGSVKGWVACGAFLIGVALLLAAREVSLRFGSAAGGAFMTAVAMHDSEYWASVMSETNGVLLGVLGTAMLLAAVRLRSRWWFVAGVFTTTAALDARAGAFLILPLLWIWGAAHFAAGTVARRLRTFALAALLSIAALLSGRLYVALWGSGHGGAHANFAYTLYGIAAGNRGYMQVFRDYPQLESMSEESERSRFAYDRALELIRRSPGQFVLTLLRSVVVFVLSLDFFLGVSTMVAILVLLLCTWRWRDPVSTLVICAFVGNVISAPILMWDGGPRVFAATIPLMMLILAVAVAYAEALLTATMLELSPAGEAEKPVTLQARRFTPVVAAAIVAILLIAPLARVPRRLPPSNVPPDARGETTIAFVRGRSGEWLDVDDRAARLQVPRVRWMSVMQDLRVTEAWDLRVGAPPLSFGVAVDTRQRAGENDPLVWFVTRDGTSLPETKRPLLLAGTPQKTRRGYAYLQVSSVYTLAEDGRTWIRVSPR